MGGDSRCFKNRRSRVGAPRVRLRISSKSGSRRYRTLVPYESRIASRLRSVRLRVPLPPEQPAGTAHHRRVSAGNPQRRPSSPARTCDVALSGDQDDLLFAPALDERALQMESGQLGHLHIENGTRRSGMGGAIEIGARADSNASATRPAERKSRTRLFRTEASSSTTHTSRSPDSYSLFRNGRDMCRDSKPKPRAAALRIFRTERFGGDLAPCGPCTHRGASRSVHSACSTPSRGPSPRETSVTSRNTPGKSWSRSPNAHRNARRPTFRLLCKR
jgi:hypothetical protein